MSALDMTLDEVIKTKPTKKVGVVVAARGGRFAKSWKRGGQAVTPKASSTTASVQISSAESRRGVAKASADKRQAPGIASALKAAVAAANSAQAKVGATKAKEAVRRKPLSTGREVAKKKPVVTTPGVVTEDKLQMSLDDVIKTGRKKPVAAKGVASAKAKAVGRAANANQFGKGAMGNMQSRGGQKMAVMKNMKMQGKFLARAKAKAQSKGKGRGRGREQMEFAARTWNTNWEERVVHSKGKGKGKGKATERTKGKEKGKGRGKEPMTSRTWSKDWDDRAEPGKVYANWATAQKRKFAEGAPSEKWRRVESWEAPPAAKRRRIESEGWDAPIRSSREAYRPSDSWRDAGRARDDERWITGPDRWQARDPPKRAPPARKPVTREVSPEAPPPRRRTSREEKTASTGGARGHSSGSAGCKIRVSNVPKGLEDSDIREAFEDVGAVKRCTVERGVAIVTFDSPSAAKKAVNTFDRGELNGQTIYVTHEH